MSNYNDGPETGRGKGFFSNLSPKSSFLVGLIGGIMFLCSVGFFVLLGVYISSGFDNDNSAKVAGVDTTKNTNTNTNVAADPTAVPSRIDIEIKEGDFIRGNPEAEIVLVEFSDIQCSYCARFHETAKQLVDNYPNDVMWVYKHFPLDSIHPEARPAAIASECVAEQEGEEGFWTYLDALFENQSSLGDAYYEQLAKEQGLDIAKFKTCLDSSETAAKVQQDYQEGITYGVQGTPGGYLDGNELGGAVPYAQLEAALQSLL